MSRRPFTARDDADRAAILKAAYAEGLAGIRRVTLARFAVAGDGGEYAVMALAEAAAGLEGQVAQLTADLAATVPSIAALEARVATLTAELDVARAASVAPLATDEGSSA